MEGSQDRLAGFDRQHVVAGVAAAVLSLVFHVAALVWLSDVRFEVAVVPRDAPRKRWLKSMQVMDVKRGGGDQGVRPGEIREGKTTFLEELASQAESLGMPPDEVVMEPPAVTQDRMTGESSSTMEPPAAVMRKEWHARQEILAVEDRLVVDEISNLARKPIPRVERVGRAPDVTVAADVTEVARRAESEAAFPLEAPPPAEIAQEASGSVRGETPEVLIGERDAESGSGLFEEAATDVAEFRPIEDLLVVTVRTYSRLTDFTYGYFRLEIKRAGAEVLPVVAKDVVFVQDCSASMAEQRLFFCRQGLVKCLDLLGAEDRFNVVAFRDTAEICFEDWTANTPESVQKAKTFVESMKSGGNTDIYTSLKELAGLKRRGGRPTVAILVTDGRSTTGLTDSSDIIGEFSKLTDGAISVFAMGTVQTANQYLLDLLTYCNRGDSFVVRGGRWSIPDSMAALVHGVSRPVLSDVSFRFTGEECEVYPVRTSNLYLDRPLVLYGRYPKRKPRVVFQVVGQADDALCDMIFSLCLDEVQKSKDKTIRLEWAKQKIYRLIGEYTRTAKQDVLEELRKTSRTYRVPIPHWGRF